MAKRPYNPNLAKIHWNYTVEEVADLYGVHKNTVRVWIKKGLQTNDNGRPTLLLGRVLREFISQQRKKNKRPCPPGSLYCVSCKKPQKPVNNMVDYKPMSNTRGRLIGTCPCCNHVINQITSLSKLEQIRHILDVTILQVE